MAAKKR